MYTPLSVPQFIRTRLLRFAHDRAATGTFAPPAPYVPSERLQTALSDLHDAVCHHDVPDASLAPRVRVLLYSDDPTLRRYISRCLGAAHEYDETDRLARHVEQPDFVRPHLIVTDLVTLERASFSLFDFRWPNGVLEGVPLLMLSQEIFARIDSPPGLGPDMVLPLPIQPTALREAAYVLLQRTPS